VPVWRLVSFITAPEIWPEVRDERIARVREKRTQRSLGCNAEVMEFGFRRADVSARADAFCPGLFFSKVPQPTFTSRGYPPSSSSSAFAYFRSVYRAFSKPAVDRCQHIASFRPGLVAAQPGKAYCSAQLSKLGPLLLGGFQGLRYCFSPPSVCARRSATGLGAD
jgi:hypothetical protein